MSDNEKNLQSDRNVPQTTGKHFRVNIAEDELNIDDEDIPPFLRKIKRNRF